ncbi:hypothetical protein BD410DRAFT_807179 [Rickenella mellea]|uniref:Uncharacterized protein n=1 Tax=Rickenella mellea TaxID=50990 RepID=A0A4Y7PQP3_9AGAM|nr:hypothetical protein BD410DRAFT_807179 [Rickenella mellea]
MTDDTKSKVRLYPHQRQIKLSRNTQYSYQKKSVWCRCVKCLEVDPVKGTLVPAYTERAHRNAASKTRPEKPKGVKYSQLPSSKKRKIDGPGRVASAGSGCARPGVLDDPMHVDAPSRSSPIPLHAEASPLPSPTLAYASGEILWDDNLDLDFGEGSSGHELPEPHQNLILVEEMGTEPGPFEREVDEIEDGRDNATPPLRNDVEMLQVPAAESSGDIQYRFDIPEPPPNPRDVLRQADRHWFSQILLCLVAWLHLHYHLPHRGVILILKVFKIIFTQAGLIPADEKPVISLNTTFRRLGLTDDVLVMPVCTTCHRVFPHDSQPDLECNVCNQPLFKRSRIQLNPSDGIPGNDRTDVPQLRSPFRPLSCQLPEFVNRIGMEDALDAWRTREQQPGILRDIMDGEVWKTIKGADGKRFFDNDANRPDADELRIGITLVFDGFGYHRSRNAGSHSTGVLSNCVANLPTHLKYRPRNLLLCGLTPGPKEFSADELQYFMKAYVDELIRLLEEGIRVPTPKFPDGCQGGLYELFSLPFAATIQLSVASFPARDGEEHRRRAKDYLAESDPKQRGKLFKEHHARYFELSRLPYFDPVRMTIIDPMHNILLGIVKSQWLDSWIHGGALRERTETLKVPWELDRIHDYLKTFEMPAWVARLPREVGYPAGGSLTADEWKGLALVYCPVVIPLIWGEFLSEREETYVKQMANWNKKEAARVRRLTNGKGKATKKDEEPAPKPTPPRMLREDSDNFLKLATALKIIMARSINVDDLPRARELLGSYLKGYLEMHPDDVKPNHHWCTHIFDQIFDYGPVYSFWSFLFERLNKVLKSYQTNNHENGEVEVTFFRAFMRDIRLRNLLVTLATSNDESNEHEDSLREAAELMLATDGDIRGTVAALAQEIEEQTAHVQKRFSLTSGSSQHLTAELQDQLLDYYCETHPDAQIIARTAPSTATTHFLLSQVKFFKSVVLDGRRITASLLSSSRSPESLVQIDLQGHRYVGQQPGINGIAELLNVRWFRRLTDIDTAAWDPYPELEVFFWEHGAFLEPHEPGMPCDNHPPAKVQSSMSAR